MGKTKPKAVLQVSLLLHWLIGLLVPRPALTNHCPITDDQSIQRPIHVVSGNLLSRRQELLLER